MFSLDCNLFLGCILVLGCILSLCCILFLCCYTGTRFQEQGRQEEVLRNHSVLGEFLAGLLSPLPNVDFLLLVDFSAGARLLDF